MDQSRGILTAHKFAEKIDDKTNKILCVTCGGKGFYCLMNFWTKKGELVSCEMCEKGFRYVPRDLNHGKQGGKGGKRGK